MKKKDFNLKNVILFTVGFAILAMGISSSILSGFGADPYNSLFSHMAEISDLSVGTMIILIGLLFLIFSGALVRRRPEFETMITSVAIGFAVDGFLLFLPVSNSGYLQVSYYLAALFLIPIGVSFLIVSKFPPTPIEVLFLSFKEAVGLNFAVSRYLLDAIILVIAIITGLIAYGNLGNVNFGTIGFTLTTGFILSASLNVVNSIKSKMRY